MVQRRESYARLLAATARVPLSHQDVINAFATVPREEFLGPPPWLIFLPSGHVATSDPAVLYEDALVSLKASAHLNNGQPSLHMACLAALGIKTGDTVVHVGAGTGYYTAIIATLTGTPGTVIAYEVDDDLAPMATKNLAGFPNVEVRHASGTSAPLPPCDAIYVSAGATAPIPNWVEALRPGGRLLFPLTPSHGAGCMLLITRGAANTFTARCTSTVVFTPCIGARDDETARRLSDAFAKQDVSAIRALHFGTEPDETLWFSGSGWWLSTKPSGE